MIQIRAAVVSALLLVIIPFIYERNFKAFIITTIIAILFHYSAAAFLFLWFLRPNSNTRIYFIAALILSYAMAVLGITVTQVISFIPFAPIQTLYNMYVMHFDDYVNVFNSLQLIRCMICVFFWIFIDVINSRYTIFALILKIYTIALCALPLFSDITTIAVRFNQLLLSVEIILLPSGFYHLFRQKYLAKGLNLAYAAIVLLYSLTNQQYWFD